MPPVPCFGSASRSFDDNFDDGSYLVHSHPQPHRPAGHSDEYLTMADLSGRDSGSGRNDAWIPLNDCDDDEEEEEEDTAVAAFDADEYVGVQGGSQRSNSREEEGSISSLNDLAVDNDEDNHGVNQEASSPPRRRLPPRRRSSAARPRKSRRRSSAVSLEKHDSVILSELASLMDEMNDDDLERALNNESHSTGGQGGVAGGEGDAEADAAAGGGPSQTHHQRRPSHRPVVRRRSAFPLGGDGESIAGNSLVRSSFRRNTISDASSGGGIRPLSFRASLGSALLHRDHTGSNLTVQRADHHQPRRNSLEGRRSPSVRPSGI